MTIELTGSRPESADAVLTEEAVGFVTDLHRRFGGRRRELLERRRQRERLDFLPETRTVREDPSWRVAAAPGDLTDRRVEITGPTEAKMLVNALNSGAQVFMADFEDANTPTWSNLVAGQKNLIDAIDRKLDFTAGDKHYTLAEKTATLVVRPRGWHLPERHLRVDGEPVAGAFFDFGLYFFHNAKRLLDRASGPYFYLPKMESHLEARLWAEVFHAAEEALGIDPGTIRATVLVETVPAAFEMEEILYELREYASGLNAGRWDYMFSMIKNMPDEVLPDRNAVTMTVPFMRAYTELLVSTCHRRGAFAMGGMAAFIPSRKDSAVNEKALAKVREDKDREAGDGFDGTWVAHPDLVPVAREAFDAVLGDAPNQLTRRRDDVQVSREQLLDVASTPGEPTLEGLHGDVAVGLRYLASWLAGNGAAGIFNLMEDAATAEIARTQVWQWVTRKVTLADGETVTPELVRSVEEEELERARADLGDEAFGGYRFDDARRLFEDVALSPELVEFLTLPGYQLLD